MTTEVVSFIAIWDPMAEHGIYGYFVEYYNAVGVINIL